MTQSLGRWIPALVLFALLAAPVAVAHGYQSGGEPTPFSVLSVAPEEVVVIMTETVEPTLSRVRVLDRDGADLATGTAFAADGDKSRLAVKVGPLPNGTYTVAWDARWLSDGHDTQGSYAFAVGNDTVLAETRGASETDLAPRAWEIGTRAAVFTGVLVAIGSLAFLVLVDGGVLPRGQARALGLAAGATLVVMFATFVLLLDQTASGYRTSVFAALANIPRAVATTHVARIYGIRIFLAMGLFVLLAWARASRKSVALSAAVGVALTLLPTLSLVSHAYSSKTQAPLLVATDLAHLLMAAVWVGGLPLFLWSLSEATRAGSSVAARMTQKFSRIATASVLLVLVTGVFASSTYLEGDPSRLSNTLYGRFLVAKIVLVLGILAVGAYNQFVLVKQARSGVSGFERRLRKTTTLEVVLAALVLVAAGGLTAASPNPPAVGYQGPITLEASGTEVHALLVVSPGTVGINTFNVTLTVLANGTALTYAKNVSIFLNGPDRDIGTATLALDHAGDGLYTARGALGFAGEWSVTVFVQRPDAYDDAVTFVLTV